MYMVCQSEFDPIAPQPPSTQIISPIKRLTDSAESDLGATCSSSATAERTMIAHKHKNEKRETLGISICLERKRRTVGHKGQESDCKTGGIPIFAPSQRMAGGGSVWRLHQRLREGLEPQLIWPYSPDAWGNIDGQDETLVVAPSVVPTADPNRRGGSRIDLAVGLNVKTPLQGHRLALEAALPVYQNLDGPQLGAEWFLTAGWQFSF